MTTLHMQTENVHATARQMTQNGERLMLALRSLSRSIQALQNTWKGGSSEEFGMEAQDLLRRLNAQTDFLLELAVRVEREALEWEETDRRELGSLNGIRLGFPAFMEGLPVAGGGENFSWVLPVTAAASISQFLTGVPDWLRKALDRLFPPPEIISPIPDSPVGAKTVEETPLGKLNKEFPSESSPASPSANPPATPSAQPDVPPAPPDAPPAEKQWWKETPMQPQRGLEYNGKPTAYGCVPASTKMVLDYWHNQNENNQTTSAQSLLDLNSQQKEFNSRGMNIGQIGDEVAGLGYKTHEIHMGKDLDFLKGEVSQGPVVAVVHLDDAHNKLNASGVPHAVVVTGISPETNEVRINDPWSGQTDTYSWDDFNKSWGSSFGKDANGNEYARSSLLVIRP